MSKANAVQRGQDTRTDHDICDLANRYHTPIVSHYIAVELGNLQLTSWEIAREDRVPS